MREPYTPSELKAWAWLMALPRIDWKERGVRASNQQVLIRLLPGKLGATSGAPGVEVLLSHPDTPKRVKGTGNSLMEAATRAHEELWAEGVRIYGPGWAPSAGKGPTDYVGTFTAPPR
jgi:hypothetical protein